MCHLLIIYVGVDLKKRIRKRAQIWDSSSLEYFAITMQEVLHEFHLRWPDTIYLRDGQLF